MPHPMKVLDLGAFLDRLLEDALPTGLEPLDATPHSVMSLLCVAGGASWDGGTLDREERRVIVLEGMATFVVDDVRQSLG